MPLSVDGSPCRVLLVEDSAEFSALVTHILSTRPDLTLEVVGDLARALHSIRRHPPDIVLLDLGLPDSDSLDTLARAAAAAPDVPIVVLTGIGDDALRLRALKQGAQDYLVKDQGIADSLIRTIEHTVQRSLALRAARARDAHLRIVLNALPLALWATDAELRITASAGAALRHLGVGDDELVGTRLVDYLGDAAAPAVMMACRALGGESVRYESVLHHRVLATDQEPLRDASGRIVGTVALSLDVTERKHREAQLQGAYQELRRVSNRLITIREQERSRLAQDLHDHFGQSLTALKMDVAAVRRRLAAGEVASADRRLAEMSALLDAAAEDVRRIATELRPVLLDELGLIAALEAYLTDVQRRTGIHCTFVTEGDAISLCGERALVLFRILQEAVTNTIRHAAARTIAVTLAGDDDLVQLTIRDDGCGIPDNAVDSRQTLGIIGMRDRASLFDGSVVITGQPGRGTTVTVALPRGDVMQ